MKIKQPDPTSDGLPVGELVLQDIKDRIELGQERYGTLLTVDNGRDALWDLYEELIDGAMYVRQEIERRKMSDFTMLVTPDVPVSEDVVGELESIGAQGVKRIGNGYEMTFQVESADDRADVMENVVQILRKHTEAWRA